VDARMIGTSLAPQIRLVLLLEVEFHQQKTDLRNVGKIFVGSILE
jgi:hypothetical protein